MARRRRSGSRFFGPSYPDGADEVLHLVLLSSKTCSTVALILDRPRLALEIASGIGLPFGFRWWMSDFRPLSCNHSSFVFERSALSAQTEALRLVAEAGHRHRTLSKPGHLQQNGRHERMHLTLKKEATRPAGMNMLQQQARFDAFVHEFNTERPYEALNMRSPQDIYTASARPYRGLPPVDYPFHDIDVLVTSCGRICMHRKKINISLVMAGQKLGIKEVNNGIWLVRFMRHDLGYIDLEQRTLQTIDNPFGTRLSGIRSPLGEAITQPDVSCSKEHLVGHLPANGREALSSLFTANLIRQKVLT